MSDQSREPMDPEWHVPHACLVRRGGWADMGLVAEVTATTVQLRDRTGRLVLVIGTSAVEAFSVTGSPPRLLTDPKLD